MPLVAIAFLAAIGMYAALTDALEMRPCGRREILKQGGIALTVGVTGPGKVLAAVPQEDADDDLRQVFQWFSSTKKKGKPPTIDWSPTSRDFSQLRYSTSSLSAKEDVVPESTCTSLPSLPSWMEGHWMTTYKFDGVSFPNGREQVSLTLPGAGLGTCAVLPNVGANPAPFVQRFGRNGSSFESKEDDESPFVVEDVAYNLPRKFEGFWPAAKVESIRVSTSLRTAEMSPSCLVTGEGCSLEENPYLHGKHATRCQMEFQGPTRGGLRTQHLDMTMVDCVSKSASIPSEINEEFLMARSFVQYNQEQELTSYYREFVSFRMEQSDSVDGKIKGRTCVAAFLPSTQQSVALYNYNMEMYSITEEEAMMV